MAAVKINAADVDIIANELEVAFLLLFQCLEHVSICILWLLKISLSFMCKTVGQEGGRANTKRA